MRPYPSAQHRASYHRRTSSERTFSTLKDPASTTIARGICRHASLTAIALHTATTVIARNIHINDAYTARQTDNHHRATLRLPPKTRARRRTPLHQLAATAHTPPAVPEQHSTRRRPHRIPGRQARRPAPRDSAQPPPNRRYRPKHNPTTRHARSVRPNLNITGLQT